MTRSLLAAVWPLVFACSTTPAVSSAGGAAASSEEAAVVDASSLRNDAAASDAGSAIPLAVEVVAPCALSGVRSVDVPAVRDASSTTRLRHYYRVFPSTRPNAPTVVLVPGGPGSGIMAKSPADAFALSAVPSAAFNIIATDARGSGCNTYPQQSLPSADVYRTEEVGRDVADVVRNENLSDYFLYGASFGTAASTVAASLLERDGGPAPRGMVLEGTVGRAFDSFEQYFAAFSSEWTRTKGLISAAWRSELEKEPWSTTLLWSREQWGMFVSAQLIIGDIPGEGHALHYWLSRLSAKDAAAQSYVGGFMAGASSVGEPGDLFRAIACRELWGSWKVGREIRDGELSAIGSDVCAGVTKVEPWDSATWKTTTPITYFQGPFDPTTTPAQADYHFAQHEGSRRWLVSVPSASHAPLTVGIQGRGCATQVWNAIAAAPASLTTVLASCGVSGQAPIAVKFADAE